MARKFPRFLYSNPVNTKSPGPFLVHSLYPKFLAKVSWLPSEQGLVILEMWDDCNDSALLKEVIKAAEDWLYHALKRNEISLTLPDVVQYDGLENLKRTAHNALPDDCIRGYGEVKFCDHRNGDGNMCKQCSDLI